MPTKGTSQELRQLEKAFAKLRNKLKRADLDFTVQVSISSTEPGKVYYAAQMTPPASNLAPIRMIAESAQELLAKIEVAVENIDYRAVEIAYHRAQMESCDRTKLGHQERIEELEAEQAEEDKEEKEEK